MNYVSIEKKKGEIFEEKDFGEVSDNKKNKISVYRLLEDENVNIYIYIYTRKVTANLKVTCETVICKNYWPKYFKKIKVFGKYRPRTHHLSGKAGRISSVRKFTTYFLKKEFFKLRHASGGTYFIYMQQIIEKVNVN